jgi:gamma-glutamyl:cysteine ligase YbdK (ATP-grasp superfamily)
VSAHESEPIRRSIEVEYWVIDEAGRLVEPGTLVDAGSGVEREFVEPLLEVKTTPCASTEALRAELFDRLERVLRRADEVGKGLVPLATPVGEAEIAEIQSERTRVQNLVVGDDFEYVRHCAGTHVHVEQQPECPLAQYNAFVALDPALALVNSSPYFRGRQLAAGARSKLYRWMAYDGLAHQGRLWDYLDSREAYDRRLERRHEEFVTAAMEAGADRRAVRANFDPESAVWTPVQFREAFGTVEWRSPDAALPSQVVALADRLAAVSARLREMPVRIEGRAGGITDEAVVLPEFDAVIGYVNSAIREGLASEAVRSYLGRMGFDVDAFSPVSHEIVGDAPLDEAAARRIRREHAERLSRDVRQASSVRGV